MILGYDSHGAEVVEQTNEYKKYYNLSNLFTISLLVIPKNDGAFTIFHLVSIKTIRKFIYIFDNFLIVLILTR
jgi:hypothetical protein